MIVNIALLHKCLNMIYYIPNFGFLLFLLTIVYVVVQSKSAQQLFIETCDLETNSFWQLM